MTATQTARVVPFLPDDARHVQLLWSSPFDATGLAQHLAAYPGRSLWVPETGEYAVGEPWRHRGIVTSVVDLLMRDGGRALIDRLTDPAGGWSHELVVLTDFANTRRPEFYASLGMTLFEEVNCYELDRLPPEPPTGSLRFARADLRDAATVDALLAIDHASFPWLWWNTPEEFAAYRGVPGVELYLGRDATGRALAYFGLTHYRGWGHLDRIAVTSEVQGRGYGLESLRAAVAILAAAGATRIGLSTQATNIRSQQLYGRFGFRRTWQNDYHVWGKPVAKSLSR